MLSRVNITPGAADLLGRLTKKHGRLLLLQSGGCCDGSVPLCYPQSEFTIGDQDILLGEVGGCPFYISPSLFDYWRNCQLTLDAQLGRGSGFSLETSEDMRFITHSRLFTDAELAELALQ